MGLAIFDTDAPVLSGLEQSFSRAQASIDALGVAVGSGEIRHAPPARIAASSPRVETAGNYRVLGGNALIFARTTALTYEIRRANADGSTTLVRTLSMGSVLVGSTRSTLAALGNPAGYDETATTGNLTLGDIRAASEHLGILRIYVEVHRYDGADWEPAAHAMFFSLDEGATWTREYQSEEHNLGNFRGREWCINPVGTPLYNRDGEPLIIAYGDSDYLFKSDGSSPAPAEARHFLSVFVRASASDPWVHSFAIAFPRFESVDHGHNAIALEYPHAGGNGMQVVCAMGDGTANNAVKRFVWEGDIDPATPATLAGAQDIANWTLDSGWTHGTLTGKGTYGNQWTAAFAGPEEGTACVLYDNETGHFGIMVAGDEDATAPLFKTRGPIHPGGRGISLFAGTDGSGRIAMSIWDDALPAYNTARMMYSPDWGESWCELAKLSNQDARSCMHAGRLFWTEGGSSAIFSRRLPSTRLVRPACVSPAGINRFYEDGSTDAFARTIDWRPSSLVTGATYTFIERTVGGANDGRFVDPDDGFVYPDPPCFSNKLLKITSADPTMTASSFGVFRLGRGNVTTGNETGQTDERVWIMSGRAVDGVLFRPRQYTTQQAGDLLNTSGTTDPSRSFHKLHGRDRWYPVFAAGENRTSIENIASGNRYGMLFECETTNPASQSLVIAVDFSSYLGGGKVSQPIPLGASGVDGSAPDELLTLTGVSLGDAAGAVRAACRIPWDSWSEWSERGVCGTKTLWRLYADADNWIVAEWEGASRRLRIRVRSGGTTRTALTLHADTAAMRETMIDIALGIDGDDLAVAASVAGETETGTVTGGALLSATLDQWRAGADESGVLSAIEVMAVETFADGGGEAAMATLLESLPGSSDGGGGVAVASAQMKLHMGIGLGAASVMAR